MDRDATECAVMDLNAPTHGYRRRSSVLTAQVLKAIRETEDEIFEDTLEFDFVALGGGVATGYWAEVRFSRSAHTANCSRKEHFAVALVVFFLT